MDGFNVRLMDERKRLNLTQKQVAQQTPVSQPTVVRYEREGGNPACNFFIALDALGFDVPYVVKGFRSPPGFGREVIYQSEADAMLGVADAQHEIGMSLGRDQVSALAGFVLEYQLPVSQIAAFVQTANAIANKSPHYSVREPGAISRVNRIKPEQAISAAFCLRLKEERMRLKLTQGVVAGASPVSRPTYIRYEKEGGNPALDFFEALDALGFDIIYLMLGKHFNGQSPPLYTRQSDAMLVVMDIQHELNTRFNGEQLSAIVEYAYEHQMPQEKIMHLVRSAFIISGTPLD